MLEDIGQPAADVRARIDVHAGGARSAALICSVDQQGSTQDTARWAPLLDRLVGTGAVHERQARGAAVLPWAAARGPIRALAEHWTRLSDLLGDCTESILHRRLHHIAIEADRGEPIHAGAHILAAHGWR